MKKHLVNIWYALPDGSNYAFEGWVNERIGYNGKAIVYPGGVFREAFGFSLPPCSRIMIDYCRGGVYTTYKPLRW